MSNMSATSTSSANLSNMNLVKLCHVCGDKAVAFNFNGLTCESCKSFFRRNAFKINKFTCYRNDQCTVDVITRKYCQKCRLQKCFDIGMKKELVLDRKRKHEGLKLADLLKPDDDDELIEDENSVEIQNENALVVAINNEPVLENQLELSNHERFLINEVNHASQVFTEELSLQVRGEAESFKHACNLPGLYIRKIIRFCKNIPQFKCLDKKDQLSIIKPYFTEILLIRFAFAYNYEKDAITVIEDELSQSTIWLKIDLLKEANRHTFALVYRKYMFSSKMEMENDTTIRNLLAAIMIFRPRENSSCPEFIRYNYFMYKRLLGRYLEHKYKDVVHASEKYFRLIAVMKRACDIIKPVSELYTLLEIQEVMDNLSFRLFMTSTCDCDSLKQVKQRISPFPNDQYAFIGIEFDE